MDEQQNDPSKWVWGIFYYNTEDKRLFPPKRVPAMGWTVNFANPYSVLVMVLILAFFGLVTTLPLFVH